MHRPLAAGKVFGETSYTKGPFLMAEEPKDDALPSFRIIEKKVDSSWKEEMRKERELAAKGLSTAPADRAGAGAGPGTQAGPKRAEKPEKEAAGAAGGTGKPSKVFVNFLAGLVQQTLMQLGRMENPFTGQSELDLEGARYTIELLAVIQEKTKGNLAAEETRVLGESLRDLKFQYVEIANEVARQMQEQVKKGPGSGKR